MVNRYMFQAMKMCTVYVYLIQINQWKCPWKWCGKHKIWWSWKWMISPYLFVYWQVSRVDAICVWGKWGTRNQTCNILPQQHDQTRCTHPQCCYRSVWSYNRDSESCKSTLTLYSQALTYETYLIGCNMSDCMQDVWLDVTCLIGCNMSDWMQHIWLDVTCLIGCNMSDWMQHVWLDATCWDVLCNFHQTS